MTGSVFDVMTQVRQAKSFAELHPVVLRSARSIASADGATFVLRDGDNCFYAAEDAAGPLWAGQRFPIADCISGWAMTHRCIAQVPNIEVDERIPVEAYRPTFVRSLVMTPLGVEDPLGAIGVYWSDPGHTLTDPALAALCILAEQVGHTVARLGLHTAPWAPNFALRLAV